MSFSKSVKQLKSTVFAFLVLTSLHSLHNILIAQTAGTGSPYSSNGIGDINGKGFAQCAAMGGTNIAMQNDSTSNMFFINTGNPASYSNVLLTTAELGGYYNHQTFQTSSDKQTTNNVSPAYVALAFPIKKWWGASFGLMPYSSVGYQVSGQQNINNNSNLGSYNLLYQGTGGINQVYFGNGIKPLYSLSKRFFKSKKYERLKEEKNYEKIDRILKRKKSWRSLSLGVNASYMFGGVNSINQAVFPVNTNYFDTYSKIDNRVRDFYFDFGMQYAYTIDSIKGHDLKENLTFLFGATFSAKTNLNARMDSLAYTYSQNALGTTVVKDTVQNVAGTIEKIPLPLSFGFGIGIKKGNRWLVSADFAKQNWSSVSSFYSGELKNSTRVSIGAQYIPNPRSTSKGDFYKRIHYRIGLRYAQSYYDIDNIQLIERALTFGLGIPTGRNYFLQNFSMVNVSCELGQLGTTVDGLIKEQYFKVTAGFTFNDRWFVKPKYD